MKQTESRVFDLLCDFKDDFELSGYQGGFDLVYAKRLEPTKEFNQTWFASFDTIRIKSYTPAYVKLTGESASLYITNIIKVVKLTYDDYFEYIFISNDSGYSGEETLSAVRIRTKQV